MFDCCVLIIRTEREKPNGLDREHARKRCKSRAHVKVDLLDGPLTFKLPVALSCTPARASVFLCFQQGRPGSHTYSTDTNIALHGINKST